MKKLFISFYLFIATSVIVISTMLNLILPPERDDDQTSSNLVSLVNAIVTSFPSNAVTVLQQAGLTASIVDVHKIAWLPEHQQQFEQGGSVALYDAQANQVIYTPFKAQQLIAVTLVNEDVEPYSLYLYSLVFFTLLAALVAFWSWPLWRDLRTISHSINKAGDTTGAMQIQLGKGSLIQPIANSLNHLSTRISVLLKDQQELLSAVAHEFRTPIARLKFALAMQPEPNTPEWDYLSQDLNELEGLVQEMLDYTQYNVIAPEMNFSEIPLKELCAAIVQSSQRHSNKKLSLTGEEIRIFGDGFFIERAVNNLVSNALRHSASRVAIRLQANKNWVEVEVHDDGEGVDDSVKESVFSAFFRPDASRDRKYGGAGLGLAIVRKIQDWHQGNAFVKDSKLGGACFVLRYPRTQQC